MSLHQLAPSNQGPLQSPVPLDGINMPSRNQTPRLYALYTVFFVLALLAAVARLLSRRIARLSLWWDDYFILAATTVHTVGFGFLINSNNSSRNKVPSCTS